MSGELVFAPLGGAGEIGMNMGLYGLGPKGKRRWLIVDCGVTFAGPSLPGIELIMPDITFLIAERRNIDGLVLTHSHEDHYGALLDLWPDFECPVFGSAFAKAMLDAKARENGFAESVPVKIVAPGKPFNVGGFTVELVPMAHSIPENFALLITTEAGNVLHTGDWKLDPEPVGGAPTDIARLQKIGETSRPLAVVSDSTNATREGESPSEADVARTLDELIAKAPYRVAVTIFASNVGRMISIARAAKKAGRAVVASGRAIHRIAGIARDLGMMEGIDDFLDQDSFERLPREKVVLICTGSQGEPRAAIARMAAKEHPAITLAPGDTVIFSSRTIPGNERDVIDIQNRLIDQGITLVTDRDALVHVSGHPRRQELRRLYQWLKPDVLVPVHGEALHLRLHAELGRAEGVKTVLEARNGDLVRLFPNAGVNRSEIKAGRVYLDGNLLCDPEESRVGERRKLAFAGHIAVSLAVDSDGDIVAGPELRFSGIPVLSEAGDNLQNVAAGAIEGVIRSLAPKRRADEAGFAEALRKAVRGEVGNVWGKKPMVEVFVHRI
ncbi:MAG: ribonuclease J [Cucumibacter sp.]